MLKKGPSTDSVKTPEGQALVKDHISYIYKQGADGVYVAAGPFTAGGEIQGIVIVRADTAEKAQEIAGADPAVKAGIFATETLPFLSPPDWFGNVDGPFMVEGDRRGVVVYRVATMEEARERAEGDPMVRVGRLAVELHPWSAPRGALPTLPKQTAIRRLSLTSIGHICSDHIYGGQPYCRS
jgi:uncharacterized protein YciI